MAKLTGPNKTELERRKVGLYKFVLLRTDYKTRAPKYEILSNWDDCAYRIRFTSCNQIEIQNQFERLVDFYAFNCSTEYSEKRG